MIRSCWLAPVAACAFATNRCGPRRRPPYRRCASCASNTTRCGSFSAPARRCPGPTISSRRTPAQNPRFHPRPVSRGRDGDRRIVDEGDQGNAGQATFADMARGQAISLLNGAIRGISNPLVSRVAGRALSGAEARDGGSGQAAGTAGLAATRRSACERGRAEKGHASVACGAGPAAHFDMEKVGRIDNPVEHAAVVYRPDQGQYLVIDNAHKLYRIIDGPAPAPAPLPIICNRKGTVTALGAGNLDGVPVHGYRAPPFCRTMT